MKLKQKNILIKEMAPRDGLQSAGFSLSTAEKIQMIEGLIAAGHRYIEITAFVNPKIIPLLADADEVAAHFKNDTRATFAALVPNEQGMERALSAGLKEVAVFTAASETFNQKNIRCSIEESFVRFVPVFKLAKKHKVKVRGYVSTAFVCPYEGLIDLKKAVSVCKRLLREGCYEVSVGDTIGLATPIMVHQMFMTLKKIAPIKKWAAHFHDTYKFGLANAMAAMACGVTVLDASTGGIGGCPYAPGAKGNLATEDLAFLCARLGLQTGLDLEKLKVVLHSPRI